MYYSRGHFWVIVDEITTDRPRKIEALWHWHPTCEVAEDGHRVFTQNERGNLQIIPLANQNMGISFVKGREEPDIQGWYSESYNTYEPNVTSIFTTHIDSNYRIVWLLFPSEKVEKEIKAEIISESPKEIKIRVIDGKNKESIVTVPLIK